MMNTKFRGNRLEGLIGGRVHPFHEGANRLKGHPFHKGAGMASLLGPLMNRKGS